MDKKEKIWNKINSTINIDTNKTTNNRTKINYNRVLKNNKNQSTSRNTNKDVNDTNIKTTATTTPSRKIIICWHCIWLRKIIESEYSGYYSNKISKGNNDEDQHQMKQRQC